MAVSRTAGFTQDREVDYNYKVPDTHYFGEIWRCSFRSVVRPNVNANRSRNQSFSETVFKLEEFEDVGFAF